MDSQKQIWQELIVQGQLMKSKLHTMLSQIAAVHDVTVHQLLVMLGIHNCQVMTIGDVSKELEILQTNASTLCKRMEVQGYVKRTRNAEDVRVVNIRLTPKGEAIVASVKHDMKQRYYKVKNEQINLEAIQHGFQELAKLIQVMEGEMYEKN